MASKREEYVPQTLNPEAQKRLSAAVADLERDDTQDIHLKKKITTKRRSAKKFDHAGYLNTTNDDDAMGYEEEEEDEVEHVKRISKKLFKVFFWILLCLLGVTMFAVGTGVSREFVKAYHDVIYNRESASATLRNECCRYYDNTLSPDRKAEVEYDCKLMTDRMCRSAKVTIGEFTFVQVVRQLAYAYSLCSEGTCYQVLMNITFSGSGLLFGAYKMVSTVMWFLNPNILYNRM